MYNRHPKPGADPIAYWTKYNLSPFQVFSVLVMGGDEILTGFMKNRGGFTGALTVIRDTRDFFEKTEHYEKAADCVEIEDRLMELARIKINEDAERVEKAFERQKARL